MKKQYTISVSKPCSENWENFKSTSTGGFCSSCQKEVVDFTTMTDKELMLSISNSTGSTCGRLRHDQVNRSLSLPVNDNRNASWSFIKTGIAGLSLLLLTQNGFAKSIKSKTQTVQIENQPILEESAITTSRTIEGVVVSGEDGSTLPGVNVVIKGTTSGTITDFDGKFKLVVNEGDVLVFSFIGLETKEYKVGKEDMANVALKMEMIMDDLVLMGEVAFNEVYQSKNSLWLRIKSWF
ncbi:MAG: carboxypeptidase-like regulatory domain-containing protein [Cyclobacteriaceae bacterium]|nr:carboxypeptidase-like regulatory domain-containing protein [Cyclobacteriaceae bacterium]